MDRRTVAALVLVMCAFFGSGARADDAYVRVLTQKAAVRSGPGADYRMVHQAARGDVMPVLERGTRGYWFLVALEDGTKGWILGEEVAPFDVGDDNPGLFTRIGRAIKGALFAPSPVPYANVELAFSAGSLGGEGVFLFRPAFFLDQYLAIELWAGDSPTGQEDVYLAGGGWTLRLAPGAAIGPFVSAGLGVARFSPKADSFALMARTDAALSVGGGFEITFKKRITLRADFREWVYFDRSASSDAQEYSGGLAIFF
jgi:hypothetical protein